MLVYTVLASWLVGWLVGLYMSKKGIYQSSGFFSLMSITHKHTSR